MKVTIPIVCCSVWHFLHRAIRFSIESSPPEPRDLMWHGSVGFPPHTKQSLFLISAFQSTFTIFSPCLCSLFIEVLQGITQTIIFSIAKYSAPYYYLPEMETNLLYLKAPAFFKWFKKSFSGNPEDGAKYLVACAREGKTDSIIWDLLKATGEKEYSEKTFLRASMIALLQREKK